MTRYVVEAHYDDGSRQLFGDPPFHNAEAAVAFGANLQLIRDTIRNRDNPPKGLLMDYAVIPLNPI
jgi:hypothetical protein